MIVASHCCFATSSLKFSSDASLLNFMYVSSPAILKVSTQRNEIMNVQPRTKKEKCSQSLCVPGQGDQAPVASPSSKVVGSERANS